VTLRPGGVVLVTGPSGAGKTTFCRRLLEVTRERHPTVAAAGVLSPKIIEAGEETAIDVIDVASGERRRLAHPSAGDDVGERPATPRWVFDTDALEWGDRLLGGATPCDLLIVDEIGILEFEQNRGWPNGVVAVDSRAFAAAFVAVRPRLLSIARGHWPGTSLIRLDHPSAADPAALQAAAQVESLLSRY